MSEILNVCLSCTSDKNTFNIFDTHECEGCEEVYAVMLKSCFNILVSEYFNILRNSNTNRL